MQIYSRRFKCGLQGWSSSYFIEKSKVFLYGEIIFNTGNSRKTIYGGGVGDLLLAVTTDRSTGKLTCLLLREDQDDLAFCRKAILHFFSSSPTEQAWNAGLVRPR